VQQQTAAILDPTKKKPVDLSQEASTTQSSSPQSDYITLSAAGLAALNKPDTGSST